MAPAPVNVTGSSVEAFSAMVAAAPMLSVPVPVMVPRVSVPPVAAMVPLSMMAPNGLTWPLPASAAFASIVTAPVAALPAVPISMVPVGSVVTVSPEPPPRVRPAQVMTPPAVAERAVTGRPMPASPPPRVMDPATARVAPPVRDSAPSAMVTEDACMLVLGSRSSVPGVAVAARPRARPPMAKVPAIARSPVTASEAALAGPAMTVKLPACAAAMVTMSLTPGAMAAGLAPLVRSCQLAALFQAPLSWAVQRYRSGVGVPGLAVPPPPLSGATVIRVPPAPSGAVRKTSLV